VDNFVAGLCIGAFLAWFFTYIFIHPGDNRRMELQEDLIKMHCQQANSVVKEYNDDYVWCKNGARFNRTKIVKGDQ
jgi:hypothetical protein